MKCGDRYHKCVDHSSNRESERGSRQIPSSEGAKECSPRRKPWVDWRKMARAPEGRKKPYQSANYAGRLIRAKIAPHLLASMEKSRLYYGDNFTVLREHIKDESVDHIYLQQSRKEHGVSQDSCSAHPSARRFDTFHRVCLLSPPGACCGVHSPTHGLRRGLHSFAASRLLGADLGSPKNPAHDHSLRFRACPSSVNRDSRRGGGCLLRLSFTGPLG